MTHSLAEQTAVVARVARRRVRRLAELVTTPLVPQDFVDLVRPLHSRTDPRGRIESVVAETADAATIRIRPGRGWHRPVAGQYVRIGIDVDGVRQWRAYSISSRHDDGTFTITVKAVPDGVVSSHLVDRARAGTIVQLDQPSGEFVLPTPRPAKTLFITAGSGITPVMSMLRESLRELDDVVLVHSCPTAEDAIFGAELRALAADRRIRLVERFTTGGGRLTVDDLLAAVPDLAERSAWACGPAPMLDALEQHYRESGMADLLRTERFRAAPVVTGVGGSVTFTRTRTSVQTDGATSVLDAGEAAGVLMPSGCRMGVCFGCVVPLHRGAVRDLRNGDLTTAADSGDGVLVQTCVSAAAGACEIAL
ncbi:ferredoxin reductase [Nocardia noduli]|uniref:ferredoxin reductase n=1 Tax=Nocardia noduli TaxID=2815722 RepID=UPI001C226864|nr:ferredoxin reductase [Nocardia noduli]